MKDKEDSRRKEKIKGRNRERERERERERINKIPKERFSELTIGS